MKQKILYTQPISFRGIEDWYGPGIAEEVKRITDLLRPYMREKYPNVRFFYETNLIATEDGVQKVLTNRIDGCPVYTPMKVQWNLANLTNGYIDYTVPETILDCIYDRDMYNSKAVVEDDIGTQRIVSSHSLSENEIESIFSTAAVQTAREIDALMHMTMYRAPAKYMDHYNVYFAEEWKYLSERESGAKPVYRGLIFSNLLYDCPVFRPTVNASRIMDAKIRILNENGGYLPIKLPYDLKAQIYKICNQTGNKSFAERTHTINPPLPKVSTNKKAAL